MDENEADVTPEKQPYVPPAVTELGKLDDMTLQSAVVVVLVSASAGD